VDSGNSNILTLENDTGFSIQFSQTGSNPSGVFLASGTFLDYTLVTLKEAEIELLGSDPPLADEVWSVWLDGSVEAQVTEGTEYSDLNINNVNSLS
jgi:hypothetical protein